MKSDGSGVKKLHLVKEFMEHQFGHQEGFNCIYKNAKGKILYWCDENRWNW